MPEGLLRTNLSLIDQFLDIRVVFRQRPQSPVGVKDIATAVAAPGEMSLSAHQPEEDDGRPHADRVRIGFNALHEHGGGLGDRGRQVIAFLRIGPVQRQGVFGDETADGVNSQA